MVASMEALIHQWIEPDTTTTIAFLAVVGAVVISISWGITEAYGRQGHSTARPLALSIVGLGLWLLMTGLYVGTGLIQKGLPAFMGFFALANVGAIGLAVSPVGRTMAKQLPYVALLGFQAFRLPLELILHAWMEQGTMPIQMTYEGHNFDIITGILGVVAITWALVARRDLPKPVALIMNTIGTGLLIAVIAIVLQSSPLPIKTYPGRPILLALYLPYAWIAPICVAGALAGHLILWRKLLTKS